MSEQTTETTNETISTPEVSAEVAEEKTIEETLYSDDSQSKADDVTSEKTENADKEADGSEEKSSDETQSVDENKEEWDYKLDRSEEGLLDNSVIEQLEGWAKENNVSKDMASEILGMQESLAQSWVDKQVEIHNNNIESWREEVKSDTKLGGNNLKETAITCQKAVKEFASEEFVKILNETGYGDHPEVVKFMYNIGKRMSNDSRINGDTAILERPAEDILYGAIN